MKILFALGIVLLSAWATTAFADGYRCEGGNYRVAVYNHLDPSTDSNIPAVIVLYRNDVGTLAVIHSERISVDHDGDDDGDGWVYEGQGNSRVDGSFLSLRLEVKTRTQDVDGLPMHGGTLLINSHHDQDVVAMRCQDYTTQE